MVDVIVYKPSPYALGFIIYHIQQERVYVSYNIKVPTIQPYYAHFNGNN